MRCYWRTQGVRCHATGAQVDPETRLCQEHLDRLDAIEAERDRRVQELEAAARWPEPDADRAFEEWNDR